MAEATLQADLTTRERLERALSLLSVRERAAVFNGLQYAPGAILDGDMALAAAALSDVLDLLGIVPL